MPPPKPRRAHTLSPATPLAQQVGGHAGVHVTEGELLLLKPALPREVAFYQFVRDVDDGSSDPSSSGGVHALRDWIPEFIGLLNLEGKLADDQPAAKDTPPTIVPISETEENCDISATPSQNDLDTTDDGTTQPSESSLGMSPQTIVLQNLLHGYRKPCVLDVKLGTVLYDEDASEEKKTRMIRKAAETTSLETGVRLTGFQVYSNHSPDPIVYGREYGYSLKPNQLSEGVRNFFPCSTAGAGANYSPSPPNANAGLPVHILSTLLASLSASLIELRSVLSGAHVRIVGGSVLIIYEGDWETAVAACGRGGGPSALDHGDDDDDDDDDDDAEGEDSDQIELEVDEQGQIVVESLAGFGQQRPSDGLSSSSSSSTDPQPRLYTVSLIDFAHTRVVPGEGPDESVLKGMDTLIRLVDQRRRELEAAAETSSLGGVESLTK